MSIAQNVTMIPATRTAGTLKASGEVRKTRVAAYCRVSTEFEEQESSYEMQVSHYTEYILSNSSWELAGIYADDGISATNTVKREAFIRMIDDCRKGKIDMILTKSISRFSRNTMDCLKYTRELKDRNIAVYFEKENINTLDAKGEVLMTIMAALAQQESESLSANVRLGIQFRNQAGKVQVNYNRFLGYTKGKDGNLVIVPEEAAVVRRIYAEYLDGKNFVQIKNSLEADGIRNGAGSKKWYASNIKQILTNEKYIGDALLQKTYTINTLEKKRVKNDGYAPKYYVEGSHEPIIEKSIFLRVQSEIERRKDVLTHGKKRAYSSRTAFSSRVFCGVCGDVFRRQRWSNGGTKTWVWRCIRRLERNGYTRCSSRTIREEELEAAAVAAVNDAWAGRDTVIPALLENMRRVLEDDLMNRLSAVNSALKEQQEELLSTGMDGNSDTIRALREERETILTKISDQTETRERLGELSDFLRQQSGAVTEYFEKLVRRLVGKITVYDEKMTVEFKSGLTVDVEKYNTATSKRSIEEC